MKSAITRTAAGAPVLVSATGLVVGVIAWLAGRPTAAAIAWSVVTAIAVPLVLASLIDGLRHGRLGVDVIALLALLGGLAYREPLAGALIATMFTTGQALERFAQRRARGELTALLNRAPQSARRYRGTLAVVTPIGEIRAGDRLLITPGEVVPVDGLIQERSAVLDEAALTGESLPVERSPGDQVLSGAVNAGGPFDLVASANAESSTYAAIVRLVREAEDSKAPLVRLADRYALIFLPLTLVMAAAAWVVSGDPVRALAVLVVATPCPLILAAPVAIVAGMSRAAQRGIIVKSGAALETLGRARVLLFDKTGTLTAGRPVVDEIVTVADVRPQELLRLAASLDQVSSHVLAAAIVEAARARGLAIANPADVREEPGAGIIGRVEGRWVALGKRRWVAPNDDAATTIEIQGDAGREGRSTVFCAVDGRLAGVFMLQDPLRPDAGETVRALREAGIARMMMLTGDQAGVAERVGSALHLDAILAQLSPAGKIDAVRLAKNEGTTVMVGDGINDAPALAAADVGVAMGARGATASSQAADIVLLVDRLDRLADAIRIARRARGIALQSITIGMGLSLLAMMAALAGLLPPPAGALLQEAIDLAVILNALRALSGGASFADEAGKRELQRAA
jgi:heavy metal translocating P-type ATPase